MSLNLKLFGDADHPEVAASYQNLGTALRDQYKLEEAEKLIRKAIELDRDRRKKRPNFDPKAFMDDRFLKSALRSLGR